MNYTYTRINISLGCQHETYEDTDFAMITRRPCDRYNALKFKVKHYVP